MPLRTLRELPLPGGPRIFVLKTAWVAQPQACARQGAPTRRCKSFAGPTGGTASWTARASIARWGLKEAAGKALARRTEIAYEARMPDEESLVFKVLYLYGRHVRICGGHKREGGCALPGEVCGSVLLD